MCFSRWLDLLSSVSSVVESLRAPCRNQILAIRREGFRGCEEITYNAETAEPAERNA